VTGVRATAKLEARVDSIEAGAPRRNRLRGTQAVLAREPASFRFEAVSPFGVVYVVTSDGHELATYLPGDHVIYRGQASPETIAAATGVAADASDVVALLRGIPPLAGIDSRTVAVSPVNDAPHAGGVAPGESSLFLHAGAPGGRRVVVGFAPSSTGDLVPVFFQRIEPSGEVALSARFGDFQTAPGTTLPVPYSIDVATPGLELSLRYTDLVANPTIADGAFAIATLPGVREASYAALQVGPEP